MLSDTAEIKRGITDNQGLLWKVSLLVIVFPVHKLEPHFTQMKKTSSLLFSPYFLSFSPYFLSFSHQRVCYRFKNPSSSDLHVLSGICRCYRLTYISADLKFYIFNDEVICEKLLSQCFSVTPSRNTAGQWSRIAVWTWDLLVINKPGCAIMEQDYKIG